MTYLKVDESSYYNQQGDNKMMTLEQLLKEEIKETLKLIKEGYDEEFIDLERDGELDTLQDKIDFWQGGAVDIFLDEMSYFGDDDDYLECLKDNYPDYKDFDNLDLQDFQSDIIYNVRIDFKNLALQEAQKYELELEEELEQEKDHSPSL